MFLRDDALGGHDVRPLCLEDREPHRQNLRGRHDALGRDPRQRGLGACDYRANKGSGNGRAKQETYYRRVSGFGWCSDPRWWYLQVVLGWLKPPQIGEASMTSEWVPSDPKLSSALRAAAGASYGALVEAALAAAITIALAPPVVVPALLTIVSSGAGALLGYVFHRAVEPPPGIKPST